MADMGKGAGPGGGEACLMVSEAIICVPGFLSESKAEGPSVERRDWSKQRQGSTEKPAALWEPAEPAFRNQDPGG